MDSQALLGSRVLGGPPDDVAPDGLTVRLLASGARGSMAHFELPAGHIGRAVVHKTVEELWFFVAGTGVMWRRSGPHEEETAVAPGTSLRIPVGVKFQLRADPDEALAAVAVTMPPWPGENEADVIEGKWMPTVGSTSD